MADNGCSQSSGAHNVPVDIHMNQMEINNEDRENEIVSQAGDVGDRELLSRSRGSQRLSLGFSADLLESHEFWSRNPSKEEEKQLPPSWEYVACLVYLAVFAIPGVLSRYLLQKFFGPSVAGVTSDHGILFLGLPSNMIGSFLMGWFGVVFKDNICGVSDQLAIGITSGYLGSLTAFSGWNQQMVNLSAHGHWLFAMLGFVAGLFLSSHSFNFGIETAKGFRWLLRRSGISKLNNTSKVQVKSFKGHMIVVMVLILMWGGLWAAIGAFAKKDYKKGGSSSGAQLWLACFIGPFGVWIRWWLARLNGSGLGKPRLCKWIPFGTLIANVSSACLMAALATLKKAVDTKKCDTVATGIQSGLLGCLSTVPAFIAEFNAMRQSNQPWRAYAYAFITIGMSFALGTLVYSVPVWTKGYK